MALNNKQNLENNYLSDFDHHLQCILHSGLVLDDDQDCILIYYFYCLNENDSSGKLFTITKMMGLVAFTGTLLFTCRKLPVLYTSIPVASAVIGGLRNVLDRLYRRRQKRDVEEILLSLAQNNKLNRMILEYFKKRNMGPSITPLIDPYTRNMKALVEVVFAEQSKVLKWFRNYMQQLAVYVPFLKEDYAYVQTLCFDDFCPANTETLSDCCVYLQKLCDVFMLMTSHFLTSLALTLCPELWRLHNIKVDEILDTIVPKMKNISINAYKIVNKKFDDLKYYQIHRNDNKKFMRSAKPKAATRLHKMTSSMLEHSNDILEKSQIIFSGLQQVDLHNATDKQFLGECIAELRSHVSDFYESLDMLHKLYSLDLLSNSNKSKASLEVPLDVDTLYAGSQSVVGSQDYSLNSIEPSADEEYELFIPASEDSSQKSYSSLQDEQESRILASALAKELKHKLKEHERFVAARKKRGVASIAEEDEKENLPPLKMFPESTEFKEPPITSNLQISQIPSSFLPPPPPPPLPIVQAAVDKESGGNAFLESLQTALKSRDHQEDIFFDEGTDED